MDYNQDNNYYNIPNPTEPQTVTPPRKTSGFAIASMVCGIVSLLMCCMGLGLPLGALAIIFAILSRRKGQTMESMSVAGIVTGIIGGILGLIIVLYSLSLMANPYFQLGIHDSFEEHFGEEKADELFELYGFDLDTIKNLE